jgi:transcriptional regulator GlxA family with amidase domain
VYVDARLDLAHRQLGGAAADPAFALLEGLLTLVASAVRQVVDGAGPAAERPRPADARIVGEARAAIRDDVPAAATLRTLAQQLDVSPYRLSRAFRRELGVPLATYRNRLRVGRALDRIEQGEVELAGLAVELGFADQAHLTRTVRQHAGGPPGALRRLLRGPAVVHT